MRTKNAKINVLINCISNLVLVITVFFTQKALISALGAEYLGINGLFSNIISMLSIAELGLGSAIIYNLYKPIAQNDVETIKSLMAFYKKCYHIIAIVVLVIGVLLIPFIPMIVGKVSINDNIYIIYSIFILDAVASYLLSYKQSIINANQKDYINKICVLFYQVLSKAAQIAILYIGGNYYEFLLISVILRIIDNYIIKIIAEKLFPYINDKNIKPLDKKIRQDIDKKIKALFFHKIGAFTITGSDSIIVSSLFSVTLVGFYSNYKLIIGSIQNILEQTLSSITASVGNLLVTADIDYSYKVFKKIRFLNLWLSIFATVCIYEIMDSWISIWIGNSWILSKSILMILCINFYFQSMRSSINLFKGAGGIWYEDRYIPLIETVVNIAISIIFGKIMGLAGVFLGTILSGLVLHLYSYPKFVFTKLFNKSYKEYYISFIKECLLLTIVVVIVETVNKILFNLISIKIGFILFILKLIINVIVSNLCLMILLFHKYEFKFYLNKFLKR